MDERPPTSDEHGLMAHVRRRIEERTPLLDRLDAFDRRLDEIGQALARIEARGAAPGALEALREAVAALEKQIGRAGREQFKANTLAETQVSQLAGVVERMRTAGERREDELAALRERAEAARSEVRMDLIRAILPALDGIDEALRSGRQVLAQADQRRATTSAQPALRAGARPDTALGAGPSVAPASADDRLSLAGRLRALLARPQPQPTPENAPREGESLRAALDAWLVGLTFVRRRLLDALASAGVVPIAGEGRPFDPRYHIAVEVVPAAQGQPPGVVAHEFRRGYLAGERVLRHAEVAVVRDDHPATHDE